MVVHLALQLIVANSSVVFVLMGRSRMGLVLLLALSIELMHAQPSKCSDSGVNTANKAAIQGREKKKNGKSKSE